MDCALTFSVAPVQQLFVQLLQPATVTKVRVFLLQHWFGRRHKQGLAGRNLDLFFWLGFELLVSGYLWIQRLPLWFLGHQQRAQGWALYVSWRCGSWSGLCRLIDSLPVYHICILAFLVAYGDVSGVISTLFKHFRKNTSTGIDEPVSDLQARQIGLLRQHSLLCIWRVGLKAVLKQPVTEDLRW